MFEIGPTLREARTRQGLGVDEMELRTKVRARYLRFLEEDRFELLPGHTYTKGFLRAYAEALGLDGKPFVDEYNSRYVGLADEAPTRRGPMRDAVSGRNTRRSRRAERESRTVVGVLAVVALATAVVIGAWRFGGEEAPSVPGLGTVTAGTAAAVTVVVEAAKGPTFVEARVGSRFGAPLYSGTLARGATQRFVGPSIYLAVERPGLVVVRVDGRRLPLVARELTFGAGATTG